MLTAGQLSVLRSDLATRPELAQWINAANDQAIADWYNAPANPTYTVWKSCVPLSEIGDEINAAELAGLSSLNSTRLQTVMALSAGGCNPSRAERRKFFDDIFSGEGGATTRPALLNLWKRAATRLEALLAVGEGSVTNPATLGFEGSVTAQEIGSAR